VTRADRLVPVVGLVSLVVYTLHGFEGALTRDLGVYSYAGQQVAEGVPPYLGILNRAGPLAHALPGIGVLFARLGGWDDVMTMRVMFMLIATAAVCLTYVLGRDLFRSRAAGVVSASMMLAFQGFIEYASNGPREKTPMTLFIICALWALTRQRWFAAGLCTALATLCLQTALFSTLAAVVVGALLAARGHRVRALARIALGGLVPIVVLGTWFALVGSLPAAIDGFYLINSRYTVPRPMTDNLTGVWQDLRAAYGLTVWLLATGIVSLVLCSCAVMSRRARENDPALPTLAAMTVGLLAGLAWTLRDYDAWPDLFPILPFAAIGLAAGFALVARRLTPRGGHVLAAMLSGTAVVLALVYAVSTRDATLELQRQATRRVLAQLPPGASITSIEAPQPLVLTRRTNPTRHQMFRSGLQDYLEDTWPGGRAGFERDLVADRPDLVAVGETVSQRWRASIQPDYVYVGSAPMWDWYARASLGPSTITRLRSAAGYDPSAPPALPQGQPE